MKIVSQSARITICTLLLLSLTATLIYYHSLDAPFVFDDKDNITKNPHIQLTDLSWSDLADVLKSRSSFRPFANFTFAWNYYFHQYDVFGYHLINLIIHIFTAFLVYLLARQTLALLQRPSPFIALLAAVLWLVNPVHTQSVTYIVQRMNSMAAMFYLLALVCYIQARRVYCRREDSRLKPIALLATALLSAILALSSKEIAATLPLIVFIYEWYFFQKLKERWLKRSIKWIAVLAALSTVVALIYLGHDPAQRILGLYEKHPFTMPQRLLSEPLVVVYYLSLLFFPHPARLTLDYDFPISTGLTDPVTTILAINAIIILMVAVVYTAKRNPLVSFAVLSFLVTLIIESSVIGLALIYEHRTYIPSVFPFIAGSWLICRYIRPRISAAAIILIAICISGCWTWQRNQVWSDEVQLWQTEIAKTPYKGGKYLNLGTALDNRGDYSQALTCFKTVMQLEKDETHIYNCAAYSSGSILLRLGKPRQAIGYFEKVLAYDPMYKGTEPKKGMAFPNNRYAATRIKDLYKRTYLNIGIARQQLGDADQAIEYYKYALALDNQLEKAWNNLGNAFFSKGKVELAQDCFTKALAIDSEYEQAQNNLRKVRTIMDKYGQALSQLETMAAEQPEDALVSYRLARLYQTIGMAALAIRQYEKALAMDPGMPRCLNDLVHLYLDFHQLEKATQTMKKLARIRPGSPTVFYNLACLYARQEKIKSAVNALKTAIDKGYDNWEHLKADPDLANIRQTRFYKTILEQGSGSGQPIS